MQSPTDLVLRQPSLGGGPGVVGTQPLGSGTAKVAQLDVARGVEQKVLHLRRRWERGSEGGRDGGRERGREGGNEEVGG